MYPQTMFLPVVGERSARNNLQCGASYYVSTSDGWHWKGEEASSGIAWRIQLLELLPMVHVHNLQYIITSRMLSIVGEWE